MNALILIVEDNPTNLKLASDILEMEGYRVEGAVDAEQAEEFLRQNTPDVILMDVGLPGMSGLTLTRKLKADERMRHVPVVALTAFAMKGDEEKAREAGCEGYISKPIDTRRLAQRVAEYLGHTGEK